MNKSISVLPFLIIILFKMMVSRVYRKKTHNRLLLNKLLPIQVNYMPCQESNHIFYKSFHDNFHNFLKKLKNHVLKNLNHKFQENGVKANSYAHGEYLLQRLVLRNLLFPKRHQYRLYMSSFCLFFSLNKLQEILQQLINT